MDYRWTLSKFPLIISFHIDLQTHIFILARISDFMRKTLTVGLKPRTQ